MARLKFRITNVKFDSEEDVDEVTACVDSDAYKLIAEIVGPVSTPATARGGTEMTIVLPVTDLLKVFREVGEISGIDPRYELGVSDIYNSLSFVVYRMIEDR